MESVACKYSIFSKANSVRPVIIGLYPSVMLSFYVVDFSGNLEIIARGKPHDHDFPPLSDDFVSSCSR